MLDELNYAHVHQLWFHQPASGQPTTIICLLASIWSIYSDSVHALFVVQMITWPTTKLATDGYVQT